MPTNLPPEFFAAEKRYRQAQTPAEKIACLEEMLSTIPKHKGTDHLRADYRRQLSRLKTESQSRKRTSAQQAAFHVEREGAAQAVLVGPTNVGKSALLAALTNATPQVEATPYTTWRPAPGMLLVGGAQVQLVDTPPLDREYVEPALIDLIRRTDLVLPVVDLLTFPQQQIEETLAILGENRIVPDFLQAEQPAPVTRLPFLVIANKCDDESLDEICQIFQELLQADWPMLAVSALTGRGLEGMKQAVFTRLELVRVYAKPPGKDPDYERPFVLKRGATVEQLAGRVHKDFLENLKYARVWGSAEFDGQMVQRDYVLQDGDVVELRI